MKKQQKQQMRFKTLAVAVALAIMPIMAAAGTNTDNISGAQVYQYADSSGTPYSLYDFIGTGANSLDFGSTSTYGPELDNTILLPGVETTDTSSTVENGVIDWEANGNQPTNRLAILSSSAVAGDGVLSVQAGSYLNLILAGDQSLGADTLNFSGDGRVIFGSKTLGIGDTQSLTTFETGASYSGILNFYNANLSIANIIFNNTGSDVLQSTGGTNTINFGGIYSPGALTLGSASGTTTFNGVDLPGEAGGGGIEAQSLTVDGATTLNFSGSFDVKNALFEATENITGYTGVTGNLTLASGQMTISPSTMGLQVGGDYLQTGGTLMLQIQPNGNRGYIGTGGTYRITGGKVVIDGENGSYTDGQKYWILESGSTSGGDEYSPNDTYYVYNGTSSSGIDGLPGYVSQITASNGQQHVRLCLGSECVAAPSSPAPAKSTPAPAKSEPAPTPAPTPAPAPVVVHVVTPVQEAKGPLVSAPSLTIQQARDASHVLVSTGIVGGGPRGLWFKGLGGSQHIGDEHGANYGLLAGYGWSVGPHGRDVAGVAFSAGQSGMGTGPQDFAKASDYAIWSYGAAYFPLKNPLQMWKLAGTAGIGLSSNSVASTSLGLPQIGQFGGHFLSTEIRASFWDTLPGLDNIVISPRLSLGYTQSWTNGYTTKGGSFLNVHVHSSSNGQFYIEPALLIGKKFNYRTAAGNHTLFPQLRLGLVQNIGPTPGAEVSSGQVAAQVAGLSYPHTQGMIEARLDMTSHTRYSKGLSGNVSVRQLFGGGASSTEAIAAIKYHW